MPKQNAYPVLVRKCRKVEDKGVKVAEDLMPDYAPKIVLAETKKQAEDIVKIELAKADIYDPTDPMVEIEVCNPFEG